MEETPLLQPNELYGQRRSKDTSRLRAYNKILEQIHHRIRVISKLPQSPCYLIYTVPPFVFGLPKLDLEDCVVYLVFQLRQGGFDIRFTYPNMIYISWMHHEKSYLIEQSPIMLAMIGSAERAKAEQEQKEREKRRKVKPPTIFKDKKKVSFYPIKDPLYPTKGSLYPTKGSFYPTKGSTNPYIPPSFQEPLSAGPEPPSAASYVPPSSFLQNVTNPTPTTTRPLSVPDYFKR
jgi:hypothetical protein